MSLRILALLFKSLSDRQERTLGGEVSNPGTQGASVGRPATLDDPFLEAILVWGCQTGFQTKPA